jgi:hypothetical protein
MKWIQLTRRTGEAGSSETGTAPVWINQEAIQFLQPASIGTRVYLLAGAIESVDVIDSPEEVIQKTSD